MKHIGLLTGVAFATIALLACNKEDVKVDGGLMKSVEVNLTNILTRSAGTAIADGTTITLKECHILFTDGTNFFMGKKADGTNADQYFGGDAIPSGPVRFHFLPAAVNKVVVVGNGGTVQATTLAALEREIKIEDQQDAESLLLYGESGLTLSTELDEHTPLYKATVNLVPRVARLEVSGFECEFSVDPMYLEIALGKIALNNYYSKCTFVTPTPSAPVNQTISDITVFPWINGLTGWSVDPVGVTITPRMPKPDSTKTFVYHTFPAMVPQLVVTSTNDGAPAYLATSGLKLQDGNAITAFEAGKIYKLAFKFKDTDFNQPLKCIDVTVTVAAWQVVPVVPEF